MLGHVDEAVAAMKQDVAPALTSDELRRSDARLHGLIAGGKERNGVRDTRRVLGSGDVAINHGKKCGAAVGLRAICDYRSSCDVITDRFELGRVGDAVEDGCVEHSVRRDGVGSHLIRQRILLYHLTHRSLYPKRPKTLLLEEIEALLAPLIHVDRTVDVVACRVRLELGLRRHVDLGERRSASVVVSDATLGVMVRWRQSHPSATISST